MSASWNMHDVAPGDRFAYWREAVLQTYLPLEPEKIAPNDFDGAITSIGSNALPLSRVQ